MDQGKGRTGGDCFVVNLIDLGKVIKRLWEEGRELEFMEISERSRRNRCREHGSLDACGECREATPIEYLEAFCGRDLCPVCLSQVKRECTRCWKEFAYWCGKESSRGFVCEDCLIGCDRTARDRFGE